MYLYDYKYIFFEENRWPRLGPSEVHKGPVCGAAASDSHQAIKAAAVQRPNTRRCLAVWSRRLQHVTIEAASHAVRCLQCRPGDGSVPMMRGIWSACHQNAQNNFDSAGRVDVIERFFFVCLFCAHSKSR